MSACLFAIYAPLSESGPYLAFSI